MRYDDTSDSSQNPKHGQCQELARHACWEWKMGHLQPSLPSELKELYGREGRRNTVRARGIVWYQRKVSSRCHSTDTHTKSQRLWKHSLGLHGSKSHWPMALPDWFSTLLSFHIWGQLLIKLNIVFQRNLAIVLPGIYPRNLKSFTLAKTHEHIYHSYIHNF